MSSALNREQWERIIEREFGEIPRRSEAWGLFESDSCILDLQRCYGSSTAFDTDDDARSWVLANACWEDHPAPEVRDECREALRELVAVFDGEASLAWLTGAVPGGEVAS